MNHSLNKNVDNEEYEEMEKVSWDMGAENALLNIICMQQLSKNSKKKRRLNKEKNNYLCRTANSICVDIVHPEIFEREQKEEFANFFEQDVNFENRYETDSFFSPLRSVELKPSYTSRRLRFS